MIWLVGNAGMLGAAVERLLVARGLPHAASDREVDITNPGAIAEFAADRDVDWIINCAAYTAVDNAESEEALALRINAEGPANLAALAGAHNAWFLHISTDYVFDGDKVAPYTEEDRPNPRSVYGRTKLEGERLVQAATPRHLIIRTSWLYGHDGPNFVGTMLRLFEERDEIDVVSDQHGSPTFAEDLAAAIVTAATHSAPEPGLYHFSNEEVTTWFGFAKEIHRQARDTGLLSSSCAIKPITTDQYPRPAARPRNSAFDKRKIREKLGVNLRPWQDALADYLTHLAGIKSTSGETHG